jgi:hypothetical protein
MHADSDSSSDWYGVCYDNIFLLEFVEYNINILVKLGMSSILLEANPSLYF